MFKPEVVTFEMLERKYRENVSEIEKMIHNNMNYINKDMFKRAYRFSQVEDESDIEVLTKITAGDTVFYEDGLYDVERADARLNLLNLTDGRGLIPMDNVTRESTPPYMCFGRLIEVEGTLKKYILENLEEVSRIGYEIYQEHVDEDQVFLGVESVSSDATVELHTPLYFAWKSWADKTFEIEKEEIKNYDFK